MSKKDSQIRANLVGYEIFSVNEILMNYTVQHIEENNFL